jgi:hypothetical protein
MYNPLFLYGPPGSGKTHFLHAMGGGLVPVLGTEGIVLTSGARFSRAVGLSLSEGRFAELEAFLGKAKAVLLDDVHLLAVTEQNRSCLDRIFKGFFARGVQVVMGSLYPPRALGALEEALKLPLGKAWSQDLKLPAPTVHSELMQAFLARKSVIVTAEELEGLCERLEGHYSQASLWLRRLVALMRLRPQSRLQDLVALLFDIGPEGGRDLPSFSDLEAAKAFKLPSGPGAKNLAVLVPKGEEPMGPWLALRLHQTAGQFSIGQGYHRVLAQSYDADQPFGVPFQIGEKCLDAGSQAALVLGPPEASALATRSAEFSHAVGHILESFGVAFSWIPYRASMSPGNFLRAHLDFLAPPP